MDPGEFAAMIAGMIDGQRIAWDRFMGHFRVFAFLVARRKLFSDADAEDAAQQVFLELWQRPGLAASQTEDDWLAQLFVRATRTAVDILRSSGRRTAREQVYAGWHPEYELGRQHEAAVCKEEFRLVIEAIGKLRHEYAEVVMLFYCYGRSHAAIAKIVNRPVNTVQTHLSRGLTQLRELMATELHPDNAR